MHYEPLWCALNGKYNKSSLNKLKKFKESPEGVSPLHAGVTF